MGVKTKIDWCDATWNPITGCLHGCEYCYARKIVQRFDGGWRRDYLPYPVLDEPSKSGGRVQPYPYGFLPTFHRYKLGELNKWKKPKNIFVCSMADLFGEMVPDEWIEEVFGACKNNPQHNYLFLTKNYLRASDFKFEKNWWIGRTYTHDETCENADKNLYLFYGDPWSTDITERANQFISIEPLLGEVSELPYYAHEYGYKWVIVGAETGKRKGKVIPKREWIEKIVKDCRFRNIPIFMKSSLAEIWGEPLIQEFPEGLKKGC